MGRLSAAKERLAAVPSSAAPAMRPATASEKGYTRAWDQASQAYLAEHPWCLGCRALGRYRRARVTDHVLPHKGDRTLFWDRANWQPACGWHHNTVKQRLERAFLAGRLKAEDLKLDSQAAIALSTRLGKGPGGGG